MLKIQQKNQTYKRDNTVITQQTQTLRSTREMNQQTLKIIE